MQLKTVISENLEIAHFIFSIHKLSRQFEKIMKEEAVSDEEKWTQLVATVKTFSFPNPNSSTSELNLIVYPIIRIQSYAPMVPLKENNPKEQSEMLTHQIQLAIQGFTPTINHLVLVDIEVADLFLKERILKADDFLIQAKDKHELVEQLFERCKADKRLNACFGYDILTKAHSALVSLSADDKILLPIHNKVALIQHQRKFYPFFSAYLDEQHLVSELPNDIIGEIFEKYTALGPN